MGYELKDRNDNNFDSMLREGLKAHIVKTQTNFDLQVLNRVKNLELTVPKWRFQFINSVLIGLTLIACIAMVFVLLLLPNSINSVATRLLESQMNWSVIQSFFGEWNLKIMAALLIITIYFMYDEQATER